MRVGIIGAGASGLMSANVCVENNAEVYLFDKNEKPGKKLYITGKGRCNVTNSCDKTEFFENIVNNKKFLYSSFNRFSNFDTMGFFQDLGVNLKIERGDRVFPESDKSSDIVSALSKCIKAKNCHTFFGEVVKQVYQKNKLFVIKTEKRECEVDKLIICTGGNTYIATGSSGDGYKFAKSFGHAITDIQPGLVPIKLKDKFIGELQGVSLKNVSLYCEVGNKEYKNFFGEMMFTSDGITGPIVLSLSSYINKTYTQDIVLYIDFKPALTEQKLVERIERDIKSNKNKSLKFLMFSLLPRCFCSIVCDKLNLNQATVLKTLNLQQITKIAKLLKHFGLSFDGLYPLDCGIITTGGVDINSINPKTMQSKITEGLYFAGEILDIDALTGGFNLQIAFTTGFVAGLNASLEVEND